MRLSKTEVKIIKKKAIEIFGSNVVVYLFGSRVDDSQKGGDIDLFIEPLDVLDKTELFEKKIRLAVALEKELGEQKIDIIIARDSQRPIEQSARQTGIKL